MNRRLLLTALIATTALTSLLVLGCNTKDPATATAPPPGSPASPASATAPTSAGSASATPRTQAGMYIDEAHKAGDKVEAREGDINDALKKNGL